MKQINKWFTEQDILNLMQNKQNRDVVYKDVFCYIDERGTKIFTGEITGKVLEHPVGKGKPSWTLISLRSDGKSIAQSWEEKLEPADNYVIWEKLAQYLKSQKS